MKLKQFMQNNGSDKSEYQNIIRGAVYAVDRENSTHLNADGCGREQISERIYNSSDLRTKLQNPAPGYELINTIIKPTKPTEAKYKPRTNLSFASKFCHYACMYLFDNTDAQDNFSIYDNVISSVLPYYAEYYKLPKPKELKNYVNYHKLIGDIIRESGDQISRNGFDHLLWYYFKAHPIQK